MENLPAGKIFQYLLLAFALLFTLWGVLRGFKYLCLELFGKPIPAEVIEVRELPQRDWGVKNPPEGLKEITLRLEVGNRTETLRWITAKNVESNERVDVLHSPICGKDVKEDLKGVIFGKLAPLWFGILLFALYRWVFGKLL